MNEEDKRKAEKLALLKLAGEDSVIAKDSEYADSLPSYGESFGRGAAQGATFGFGDELSAALGALLPTATDKELGRSYSDRYDLIRDKIREENKEAELANPKMYLGGQVTGGIGTAAVPTGLALKGAGLAKKATNIGSGILGGMALDAAGQSEKETIGGRISDAASSIKDTGEAAYKLAKDYSKSAAQSISEGDVSGGILKASMLIPVALAIKTPKLAKLAKEAEKNGKSFVSITTKQLKKYPELTNLVARNSDDVYHVTRAGNIKGIQEVGSIVPKVGQVRKSTYGMDDVDIDIPELVFMGEEPGLAYGDWKNTLSGNHISNIENIPELKKRLNKIAVARIEKDPDFIKKFDDEKIKKLSGDTDFDIPDYTVERGDIVSPDYVSPKEIVTGEDVLPYLQKDKKLYTDLKKRFPKLDKMIKDYKTQTGWKETIVDKGNEEIRSVTKNYLKANKITNPPPKPFKNVNSDYASKVAQAYEEMKHSPNSPEVKKAYDSLIDETMNQFNLLRKNGLKISRIEPGMENPYKNSADLHKDIKENNHMWYYPTESGFGTKDVTTNHPLLKETNIVDKDKPLLANDIFRIVHDYFGHAKEGISFGPKGEEAAYRIHKSMYSPEAQKALATETRGQNSWVNFGPYGKKNRLDPKNTVYAEQKAGLLPDWAMDEYD